MENKNILVERETYEKNGKTFYTYFIKGTLRGKEIKATVTPMDIGGYAVLDIVFDGATQANLVVKPYELKDEKTGSTIKGNSFAVSSIDEDGREYECPPSDAPRQSHCRRSQTASSWRW